MNNNLFLQTIQSYILHILHYRLRLWLPSFYVISKPMKQKYTDKESKNRTYKYINKWGTTYESAKRYSSHLYFTESTK